MSGTFSIGGNTVISHSGAEGSGTVTLSNVTLSNVTASGIKMNSSGNTITDSSGNAVLSESGGVVTLGESVNPNNSYAYYTMTGSGNAGTGVGVISAYTAVLEDSNFYTSSFASLALTVNIAKAGYYKISNSFYIYGSANVPLYQYETEITGTATKYGLTADSKLRMDSGLNAYVAAGHQNLELTFLIQATANQTIIIKPLFPYTLNSGNLYFGSNLEIIKVK